MAAPTRSRSAFSTTPSSRLTAACSAPPVPSAHRTMTCPGTAFLRGPSTETRRKTCPRTLPAPRPHPAARPRRPTMPAIRAWHVSPKDPSTLPVHGRQGMLASFCLTGMAGDARKRPTFVGRWGFRGPPRSITQKTPPRTLILLARKHAGCVPLPRRLWAASICAGHISSARIQFHVM
jgi:hypothetical protein